MSINGSNNSKSSSNTPSKEFCIIELHKKWAICGWRNNQRFSIGMPIRCKIIKKKGHIGILYKDRFYAIDGRSGFVY